MIPLEALLDDERNANRGTERGHAVLGRSVREFGAGRSLVVDREGRLVAGNKTREAMLEAGFTKAVVVKTDGRTAVVVQRDDWDLSDLEGAARRYAFADNRAGELDLLWDSSQIRLDVDDGVDLAGLFSDTELAVLLGADDDDGDLGTEAPEGEDDGAPEHECPKCGHSWSDGP